MLSHGLFVSINVVFFNENVFPFKHSINPVNNTMPRLLDNSYTFETDFPSAPIRRSIPPTVTPLFPKSSPSLINDSLTSSPYPNPNPNVRDFDPNSSIETSLSTSHSPQPTVPSVPASNNPTRNSTRIKNLPFHLQDFHCNLLSTSSQPSPKVTYPISNPLSYQNCTSTYRHFCCTISSISEPKTYLYASKLDC